MKKFLPPILVIASLFSSAVMAERVEGIHPNMNATHMIIAGGSYQTADAEFRASVGDLPEVTVDLDDLAIDDKDMSWALEYRWRFSDKWVFSGMAYTFEQTGSRQARRDFNFDGFEFQAGADLDTELEVDTYIVDALYSVYRTERSEILVGGGFHILDLEASIQGRAFVGEFERESARGSSDILAPLPNLRAQGMWAFTERWAAMVSMGWLSANIDDYDGGFAYVYGRMGYRLTEHVGVNIGYQFTDFNIEYKPDSNRESEFDVSFHGPTLSLAYRF